MSKQIHVGAVAVGGGAPGQHPIHVQYPHPGRGAYRLSDPPPGGGRVPDHPVAVPDMTPPPRPSAAASTSPWLRYPL